MSSLNLRYAKLFDKFKQEMRCHLNKLGSLAKHPLVYAYREGRLFAYENLAYARPEEQVSTLTEINAASKMMYDREIWFQEHPIYGLEAHVVYSPDFRDKILVDVSLPFMVIPIEVEPGIDGFI